MLIQLPLYLEIQFWLFTENLITTAVPDWIEKLVTEKIMYLYLVSSFEISRAGESKQEI